MSVIDAFYKPMRPEQKAELERLLLVAKKFVPQAVEGISYGMPALKYNARPLIGFGAHKNHLSLYPFSPKVITALKDQLTDYETTPGTIRFSETASIPDDLLKQVIDCRLAELTKKR